MEQPDIRIDPTVKKPPFDRAAHCRNIASKGGQAVVEKMGRGYMREIGRVGFQVYADRHCDGNRGKAIASLKLITSPDRNQPQPGPYRQLKLGGR